MSARLLAQVGGIKVTSNAGHVECLRCARREAPPDDAVVQHIDVPQFVGGKCPMRLTRIY
jgi:hypothetical protein